MTYIVKSLGKRNKGEVLNIKLNSNNYYLKLTKKEDYICTNLPKSEDLFIDLEIKNLEVIITITENAYWFLIVEKKPVEGNENYSDFVMLIDYKVSF